MSSQILERAFKKVAFDSSGCWLWTGCIGHGYGQIWAGNKRNKSAHRVMYEAFRGPVPAGLELDHLCRVTACCNPFHLEAVSHTVNVQRGTRGGPTLINANATECKYGHPLSGDNLYIYPSGKRGCRQCRARLVREFQSRNAEKLRRKALDRYYRNVELAKEQNNE